MAPSEELINGAIDRRAWDGERPAARTQHNHSDELPTNVDEGTAFGSQTEGQVKPNEAVYSAAANTSPSSARECNNAKRG
jgi:hypothetical protein